MEKTRDIWACKVYVSLAKCFSMVLHRGGCGHKVPKLCVPQGPAATGNGNFVPLINWCISSCSVFQHQCVFTESKLFSLKNTFSSEEQFLEQFWSVTSYKFNKWCFPYLLLQFALDKWLHPTDTVNLLSMGLKRDIKWKQVCCFCHHLKLSFKWCLCSHTSMFHLCSYGWFRVLVW